MCKWRLPALVAGQPKLNLSGMDSFTTTLWNMGYHLRRCSFCNRWRLFKRRDRNRPHPDDMTAEELTEDFNRKIAAS